MRESNVSPEPDAVKVLNRWEEGERSLVSERRSFWLSSAFYHDEQWVSWRGDQGIVQQLKPDSEHAARLTTTHNLIKPNIETLLGKFLGADLGFECPSTEADSASMQQSRLKELILEGLRVDQDWETKRGSGLFDTMLGGTSAIAVDWDTKGARQDSKGKIHQDGNVQLTELSIAEFTLQPGVRHHLDAYWWCRAVAVPTEQVRWDYDLNWTPMADAYGGDGPASRRLLMSRGYDASLDLCNVYTYYERPNPQNESGVVLTVCNGKVIDGPHDWPFPFEHRLNLIPFRQQMVSGRWSGDTFMNSARTIQREYNAAKSMLLEHNKRAAIARLAVPYGALDDDTQLTDEPGEILPYYPDFGDNKPHWIAAPGIPRWQYQLPDSLRSELDHIMHITDVMRGIAPGDRNSGAALGILKEGGETPLARMAREQANGWGAVGELVIHVLSANVSDKRTMSVEVEAGDTNVPMDIEWNGSMLGGPTRVRVPLDSTMPKSRTQRMVAALQLIDRGLIPQNPILHAKLLQLGPQHFGAIVDPDASKAQRENLLMEKGSVEFPEAYDNHGIHMAEHNAFRKSTAWRRLDPESREIVDLHVKAHEQLEMAQAAEQMAMNQVEPGLAGMPQGDEPSGSGVPSPQAAQQMAQAQMQAGGGGGGAPQGGGM